MGTIELARPQAVSLPLITKPRVLIGLVLLVVILTGGAFAGGWLLGSREAGIIDAADSTIPVTALVESRVVASGASVQGLVRRGDVVAVAPTAPAGADRAVAISLSVAPGDEPASTALLGVVSNRPIFLLTGAIPLFRPMRPGDAGADVTSFQTALNSAGRSIPVTGRFDRATMNAVAEIYTSAGFTAPGSPGARYVEPTEWVTVTGPSVRVASVANAGDVISNEAPLAVLQTTTDYAAARVSVLDQDAFITGTRVHVRSGGSSEISGVVASVSEFRVGDETNPTSGYDIVVDLESDAIPAPSTPVSIETVSEGEVATAVPLTALREDSAGTYVLVRVEGEEPDTRVDVEVIAQADGWVAVAPNDALSANDRVVIR